MNKNLVIVFFSTVLLRLVMSKLSYIICFFICVTLVHGLIKIVVDKVSHHVIGVHYPADHADSLIEKGIMMVAGELT
jgi:hypothetical protein